MKKAKLMLLIAATIFQLSLLAQAPQKFSYQAVVKNASNNLVTNHAVGLKISILNASSTVVYCETQTPVTNANGLISVEVGAGTVISGTMAGIAWSSSTYSLKSEIDPLGGTSYSITGTSSLLSVPYALHAKTVENAFSGSYSDLTNKPAIANTQWTTTGSNIYYNSGNVGIGKATPTAQLDVLSSNTFGISSTGTTTGSTGLYHIANSNAPTSWNLGVEGGAWASGAALGSLYIDKNGVGPKMTITPDGNVGIGTFTPLSKLQVYGTETGANWAGRGAFGGASSAVVLGQYNNKAYFGAHNAALDTWTDLAINPGGGNVGIGTTTPSVALDVNGSFKASGMPTIICPITTVTAGNNFPFGASETKTGNISSDGSSITVGETGFYLISFALGFGTSSHGWITVNGAGRLVSWSIQSPDIFTTTTVAQLNSGDVIRLFLYSGTFSTDVNRKFICVTKLH